MKEVIGKKNSGRRLMLVIINGILLVVSAAGIYFLRLIDINALSIRLNILIIFVIPFYVLFRVFVYTSAVSATLWFLTGLLLLFLVPKNLVFVEGQHLFFTNFLTRKLLPAIDISQIEKVKVKPFWGIVAITDINGKKHIQSFLENPKAVADTIKAKAETLGYHDINYTIGGIWF